MEFRKIFIVFIHTKEYNFTRTFEKEAKINMKNTKLSVGLIACLLSVGGLAGCSKVKSSSEGVLLTYTIESENHEIEHKITADEILEKAYDDSSKYQAIYDVIYSVLVKNYFNREAKVYYYGEDEAHQKAIGKGQMGNEDDVAHGSEGSIYGKANQKVDNDIDTAHTNADANNTSYKKELEAILDSNGVKTLDELKEKYVEELQKETFEKNFYTYYIEDIKQGAGTTRLVGQTAAQAKAAAAAAGLDTFWTGYFEDQLPYHVSHILVKLEDGSGTNYADGTISEANAKKLYDVVKALGDTSEEADTFYTIAKQYSEDTGSGKLYGDLGIMDTSTSFVNEFKLGIYAYENYYGEHISEATDEKSNINALKFKGDYEKALAKSFGESELSNNVPTISSEVFTLLKDVADVDKDEKKYDVLDDAKSLYPRNIIYNKYLNRHSVAFITGDAMDADDASVAKDGSHGYYAYPVGSKLGDVGKGILSVKVAGEWRPILCVRAGSDYQGIHFIVINRSPFLRGEGEEGKDGNGVSQTDYYTTFYPDQDLYPEVNGKSAKTYINFSSNDSDITGTKNRAEELASKLKSFDSDRLGKYIFKKYLAEEKVVIKQEKLKESLFKWIDTSVEKAEAERKENWDKTWTEYIDSLSRQGSERSKLVPQACRLVYKKANDTSVTLEAELMAALGVTTQEAYHATDVYKEIVELYGEENYNEFKGLTLDKSFKVYGGLCNDGKEHVK